MKLNLEQTEQLFAFTRQHYVEYYDLQLELVDHLAHGIESAMTESPAMTFEQALQLEFKKFGIFGFMDVVEKRQATLTRKYHLLVWKHLLGFFRLPKIIGSVTATALLYYVLISFYWSDLLFVGLFAVIVILNFVSLFWQRRFTRKLVKTNQKRWLFKEIICHYGNVSAFAILPLQLLNFFYRGAHNFAENRLLVLAFCVLMVVYSLFSYIIIFVIPSKATIYLKQTYPEFEIAEL